LAWLAARDTDNPMNVVLFGATGMVGAGALIECLADARVRLVLAITRSPTGRSHVKLREVIHSDFFNYDDLAADFASRDACFFCLGVSSVGMRKVKDRLGPGSVHRVSACIPPAAAVAPRHHDVQFRPSAYRGGD
jgi:hypothetical protein